MPLPAAPLLLKCNVQGGGGWRGGSTDPELQREYFLASTGSDPPQWAQGCDLFFRSGFADQRSKGSLSVSVSLQPIPARLYDKTLSALKLRRPGTKGNREGERPANCHCQIRGGNCCVAPSGPQEGVEQGRTGRGAGSRSPQGSQFHKGSPALPPLLKLKPHLCLLKKPAKGEWKL